MTNVAIRRVVVAIPDFKNRQLIDAVRERFDPSAKYVPPHIVLVFPFQSDMPAEDLARHMQQSLAGVAAFQIILQGITGFADRFLLMNVKIGNDELIFTHDKLYGGPLAKYFQPRYTFFPHLGVGFVPEVKDFMNVVHSLAGARDEIIGTIKTIAVQRIFEDKPPEIELRHELDDDNQAACVPGDNIGE